MAGLAQLKKSGNVELALLPLQDVILSAMTENRSLSETMFALCSEAQRIAPELVVSTIRLENGRIMRPLASPGLPSSYDGALDGTVIGPAFGACGRSMLSGQPVLTRDIHLDPHWRSLLHVVEPLGLRACWSYPIKGRSGRVLGSLAFYLRQPADPTEFHATLARACLRLCALVFEHEEVHNSLERLAYFDTLTGLPNRGMLDREGQLILGLARRSGSHLALLMIDVDHFKQYNDTRGHLAGDEVLRLIASSIAGGMSHPRDVAARYGGEEFCVVLQDTGLAKAVEVAEFIRKTIEEGADARSAGVFDRLTVSIGVSVFDGQAGDSFRHLLERADQCLYEAKRTGRNRVVASQLPRRADQMGSSTQTGARASQEMPGVIGLEEIAHLYGEDLAPQMEALTGVLKPVTATVIDEFYQHLGGLVGAGQVIRSLAEHELYHLKQRQMANLLLLASPELTSAQHRAVSLRTGRIHAILGLSSRDLLHSQEILHTVLSRHVDANAHHAALATLSRRFVRDMTWQVEASRLVWETVQNVLLRVTELSWRATSHAELIGQAASILSALNGAVGCAFGRPGAGGIFRFESVSGERLKAYYADLEASDTSLIMKGERPQGQGPTGRAWSGGQVERCISIETDPRMAPWREIARRHGIRSSVAVPLSPPDRTPGTVLTLYSELPGGYDSAEQAGFIRQLQAVLTFAISRLESGSRAVLALPWSTRQRWASLIATSALEMHYQPIRDLRSGEVTRAEALVRLRDGDELLAPGKFFPCLSREDFVAIYTQGLHQVLDQQNRWFRDGIHVMVSVNLPAEALHDPRYYDITREALRRYGARPGRLMLEILETPEKISGDGEREGLEKFRALGIELAEDDMGSGHSSLDRLRALPFDVIKLDRSLVLGVEQTPVEVLSSIYQLTSLCHALDKWVVVEGVECAELIHAVALLGADAVQGYAVARPMPAMQFTSWIRQHGRDYQAPDPMAPRGYLPQLARLLAWEAHLKILFGSSPSRVVEIPGEYKPVLPLASVDPALQAQLLDAAVRHGTASQEYRAVRDRLFGTLNKREAGSGHR